MKQYEETIIDYVKQYRFQLFLIIMVILNLFLRYEMRGLSSGDYQESLLVWYHEIAQMPLKTALTTQVGDYNVAYQIIVLLLTRIRRVHPLIAYKLVSIFFDFVLAYASGKLISNYTQKKNDFFIVFTLVLYIPTVILNSSAWAQCDAIYASFIMLALLFSSEQKWCLSFLMLGFGFAFKLQTVFILPFYVYLWARKKYSITNILWLIAGFYLPCLPAIIAGRSVFAPVSVYLSQAGQYPFMSMMTTNLWSLVANTSIQTYYALGKFAIVLTVAIYGFGMLWVLNDDHQSMFKNPYWLLRLACWSCWTASLFLPAIHERYFYVSDLLLILCAFTDRKLSTIAMASFAVLCSLMNYNIYLFATEIPAVLNGMFALITLGSYVYFTSCIFRKVPCEK